MNIVLWVFQVFIAATFLYSGICKTVLDQQTLIAKGQTGVAGLSSVTIRLIGVSEILGAIGLVFPWWLQIVPGLTPAAAICFAVVMILAIITHLRLLVRSGKKKELRNVTTNVLLLCLCLLIAWFR
jgi:DoxX-like family